MTKLLLLLGFVVGVAPGGVPPQFDDQGGSSFTGTMSGATLTFADGSYLTSSTDGEILLCKSTDGQSCRLFDMNYGGSVCSAPTSDAATGICSLKGRDAYPRCTAGNCTPVGLGVSGGLGQFAFTSVTRASCSGQNVTVTAYRASGSTTYTCTEGSTWTCATDNNTCAQGLATCIAAAAADITYIRSNNNVYLQGYSDILKLALTSSSGSCATASNGSIGPVNIYGATSVVGNTAITGTLAETGNSTFTGTVDITGATSITGNETVNGASYNDGTGFACTPKATDAATATCSLKGQDVYSQCTGGNCTPSGISVGGGLGHYYYSGITQASCAGQNVAITATRVTGNTTTTCTVGSGWTCATDDATCAEGLKTCINAAVAGITASRATNNVHLAFAPSIVAVSMTSSSASCATVNSGTVAPVKVYGTTTITGATTVTGASTLTGNVGITGDVTLTGAQTVSGGFTVAGTMYDSSNGLSCSPAITDTAPLTCSIKGEDVYAGCTAGNCTPVGLGVSGGIGAFNWSAVTQASCAGQNVTAVVTRVTGNTTVTCTEGSTWTCATDDATCAEGLKTCVNLAAGGVTATRTSNTVYVTPASNVLKVNLTTSSGTCATANNGTIGPVKIYGATTITGDTVITGTSVGITGATTITGATGVTGALTVTGSVANNALTTMTPSGTTQTIDWTLGNVQKLDLEDASGNVTITDSGKVATGVYTLIIQQDGGGNNRTVTFPATTYFAGGTATYTLTVTATADAIDVVTFVCASTTVCYATVSQDHK